MAIRKFFAAVLMAVSALTSATAFAQTGVLTGTVKFFNETKGFGFIKQDASGPGHEYFVHVSGLIDRVVENDKVQFELLQTKKGLNAVNVRVIPK